MLLRLLNWTGLIVIHPKVNGVYYDFPKGPNFIPPFHPSAPLPSISTIFAFPPILTFPSTSLRTLSSVDWSLETLSRKIFFKFNM